MNSMFSEYDFQSIRDFFYKKTGIFVANEKKYFIERRIIERMQKLMITDMNEYFVLLTKGEESVELVEFINSLTVNETYFFREFHQLRCLAEEILPEFIERNEGVRIWSAGCSTGEEPYSLAIVLQEMMPKSLLKKCEIIATDIDYNVLKLAKIGRYGERSIKNLPIPYLKNYFSAIGENEYEVGNALKKLITFSRVNLYDLHQMDKIKNVDIIFCRNVLIYFDDRSKKQVVLSFFESLNPGGYIFLGHSESMNRITPIFKFVKKNQSIIYQKPM